MDVKLKKLPNSEIEFSIELSATELDSYFSVAIQQLGQAKTIKGFRRGQAPAKILKEHLDEKQVFSKAVDLAVKESFVKAVLENKLEPIGEPKIEILKVAPGNPLIFKAQFPVVPRIEVVGYDKFNLEKKPVSISEEDIDTAIVTLQKARASFNTVAREAKKGDRVEIDFTTSVGGSPLEDGTSKQHPLVIGQGHFMKGFEDELIGMKGGEKKEFSLVAPKDYYRKDLFGKTIDFVVSIGMVQEVDLPKLDDDFAKKVGKFPSMSVLRSSIKDGLTEEKKGKEKEKVRLKMVDLLIDKNKFDVPGKLVEEELSKMENEFISSLAKMGIDKESYLAHISKSPEDLKTAWQTQAQRRVRAAIILREIASKENIVVSPEEVETRANEFLKDITNPKDTSKIDLVAFKNYIQGVVRNEKVFEFLEKNIKT